MLKRLAFVSLVLTLVLVGGVTPVGAKVQLVHLYYGGNGQSWYDYLVDRAKVFNEQNPDIEVQVMQTTSGEYLTKLQVMLAGGTPPDITDAHPVHLASYIINGTFTDLRPYLAKDSINLTRLTSPLVTSVLTAQTGSIWGLPADIFPVVTYYNVDMFDKAGLPYPKDLGNKWSWDQALLSARKMRVDENGDGKPEQWGMDRMWSRWYMWIHQAGGSLYDKAIAPTKSLWNTPEVITGLNFPITAIREGLSPMSNTPGYAQTYFWFGRTAIDLMDGPGPMGSSLKNVPFHWDIAQQVRGPVNAGTEITVDAFEMIDSSTHKNEAWKWMKFISLDTESQSKFVEMTGRAPSLSALQRRYRALCPYLPENYMAIFDTASAPGTRLNYLLAQQTQINSVVNPMITKILSGQIPAETGATQIHEQVTAIFQGK